MTHLISSISAPTMLTPLQKRWAFAGVLLVLFLASLNLTVVGTALPRVVSELGGIQLYSWAFTGYFLSSTLVIAISGRISDIYGRKKLVLLGIVIFAFGSTLLSLSPDMLTLIALRAVQGVGGGLLISMSFATIADIFDPLERGKYQGFTTSVFGFSSVVGPLIGGLITDHLGWRYVFLVNLPFALLAFLFIQKHLQGAYVPLRATIDHLGNVLLGTTTLSLLLGLTFVGLKTSWTSPEALVCFGIFGISLIWFVLWERKFPSPVINLKLFQNRTVLLSNLAGFLTIATMQACIMYLPLYMQGVKATGATLSGLLLTPLMVGQVGTSALSGILVSRTGSYKPYVLGGAWLSAVALACTATINQNTPVWHVLFYMVLLGMGIGPVMSLLTLAVQNAVSREDLGMATSLNQFFRQLGGTIFVTILGVFLNQDLSLHLLDHLPRDVQDLPPQVVASIQNPNALSNPALMSRLHQELLQLGGPELASKVLSGLREMLAGAVHSISLATFVLGVLAVVVLWKLPHTRLKS
ncbi:MDR family MFS transporter [Deinococcus roseus]|nr:MDR family MFS transporter [Deinococcus roseus]